MALLPSRHDNNIVITYFQRAFSILVLANALPAADAVAPPVFNLYLQGKYVYVSATASSATVSVAIEMAS
jgi:hypothetical protein